MVECEEFPVYLADSPVLDASFANSFLSVTFHSLGNIFQGAEALMLRSLAPQ